MKRRKFLTLTMFLLSFSLLFALSFSANAADKKVISGDFVFSVGKSSAAVVEYTGKSENVKIPSSISSVPVTQISDYAFWQNKTMKSVSIPSSVKKIGVAAFNECTALTKVVLPKNFTTLGDSAFWYCTGLKQVVMYDKVTSIGTNAFKGCSSVTVYVCKGSKAESLVKKTGVKLAYTYITSLKTDSSFALEIDQSKTLSVTLSPTVVYNKKVSFSSSDSKTVSVSSAGVVKALRCGSAVITVKAQDGSGKSAKLTVTVKPKKVSSFKQSAKTATSHTLSWNASKGAQKYRVYQYDEKNKKWLAVSDTTKTSLTISKLTVGTKTGYMVKAYCTVGKKNIFSSASASVTASTTMPAKVTGLAVSSQSANSITLKWSKASNASGYKIYTYNSSKKTYSLKADVKTTSCTVKNLSPAKGYSFVVRSYITSSGKTALCDSYSSVLSCATKPAQVTGFAAEAASVSSNEASFKWEALSGVTGYQLAYIENGAASWKTVKITGAKSNAYTLTGLESETAYSVKIRAYFTYNGQTYSGSYSSAVNVVTLPKISAVEDIWCTGYSATYAEFSWEENPDASGYDIYSYDKEKGVYTFIGSTEDTCYLIKGLNSGEEFFAAVKAYVISGSGKKYESENYSVLASCKTLPAKPQNLGVQADETQSGTVILSWSETNGADGYIIRYGEAGSAERNEIKTTESHAQIGGLKRHTDYVFSVCAYYSHSGENFCGSYCDEITGQAGKTPHSAEEAFEDFTIYFKPASESEELTVFENTAITNESISKESDASDEILAAVISATGKGSKITQFKNGKDEQSGKTVSEFFGVSDFEKITADKLSTLAFCEDGNGFSVSFECDSANSQKLGSFFTKELKDDFEQQNSFKIVSQKHNITVTNAKVSAEKIDSMKVTDNAQFDVLCGGEIYTVSFTRVTLYAFSK
ncbi:MAG: fibronectin type III domain-containing protein [Acutalibacteraceae bacterium]